MPPVVRAQADGLSTTSYAVVLVSANTSLHLPLSFSGRGKKRQWY